MIRSFLNYVLVAAFGAVAFSADTAGQVLVQALRNGDMGSVRAGLSVSRYAFHRIWADGTRVFLQIEAQQFSLRLA